MFYDIVIHPSRIELVHRYFSPEKNVLESKKLAYKDIDFKFGVKTVEDGENYSAVKKVIEDLLISVKGQFNCINIIPPVTFFQFKEFPVSNENAGFDEYILWEAFQMATDVPEHYKFGFIYEEKDASVFISLVRRKVYYYFRNLLHELFPEGIEMKLLSAYRSLSDSDQLIEISKDLTAPFTSSTSKEAAVAAVSIDDEPRKKKSMMPVFAVIIILLLTTAALYIFKPGLFNPVGNTEVAAFTEETTEETPPEELSVEMTEEPLAENEHAEVTESGMDIQEEIVSEEIIEDTTETDVVAEVQIDIPEEEPEEIPAVQEKRPPTFWETVSLLSNFNADSILFESGSVTIFLTDPESVEKAKQIDETGSFVYEVLENSVKISHDSFSFKKYGTTINKNNFIDIKNENYLLFSDNTYTTYKIKSKDDFKNLFKGLDKKKVEFKSFRIIVKDNIYYFTANFD